MPSSPCSLHDLQCRSRRAGAIAPIVRLALVAAVACLSLPWAPASAAAQGGLPRSGRELVERMHAKYAGKWFHTLAFLQWTTRRRPDGTQSLQTWAEATQGDRLRIDFGPPADGNGVLYTPDSVYLMHGGQVAQAAAKPNPLLPFVTSLYLQPVPRTLAQLARDKYDMNAVRADTFDGHPVYVVGARQRADLSSPQFWVDTAQLVLRRVILPLPPAPGSNEPRTEDIRMRDYVPVEGALLATLVEAYVGGELVQREVYTDYRVGLTLPDDLFDPARWMSAPHWLVAPSTARAR